MILTILIIAGTLVFGYTLAHFMCHSPLQKDTPMDQYMEKMEDRVSDSFFSGRR